MDPWRYILFLALMLVAEILDVHMLKSSLDLLGDFRRGGKLPEEDRAELIFDLVVSAILTALAAFSMVYVIKDVIAAVTHCA